MSYNLSWFTPNEVMYLQIEGQPDLNELREINQYVTEMLNNRDKKVSIVINAVGMKAGYQTSDHLRDTQKYMDHSMIKQAYFISDNKLNRLITLMAFSLSRVRLVQFDNLQIVVDHLKRQGFETTISA